MKTDTKNDIILILLSLVGIFCFMFVLYVVGYCLSQPPSKNADEPSSVTVTAAAFNHGVDIIGNSCSLQGSEV